MDLPVAFYFKVQMDQLEVAFKEVSGLSAEMELETITEGGVNGYEYHLPKQIKHGNLIMKRALQPLKESDIAWIKNILESQFSKRITPVTIRVKLLSGEGKPLYTWACSNAFPVKWEVDTLDSEKNSVLIETLEFAYISLARL